MTLLVFLFTFLSAQNPKTIEELKKVIDIKPGSDIEFLPITIIDHQGEIKVILINLGKDDTIIKEAIESFR